MTRREIIAAIQAYTGREDIDYGAVFPVAQADIDRRVRLRTQQRITQLEAQQIDGANHRGYVLPRDYLAPDFLISPEISSPDMHFQPAAAFFSSRGPYAAVTGGQRTYTVYGDLLYVTPLSEVGGRLTFGYYAQLPALVNPDDENSLSTGHPDIYTFAGIVEVYRQLEDAAHEQKYAVVLDAKLEAVKAVEQRAALNLRDLTASPPRRRVV